MDCERCEKPMKAYPYFLGIAYRCKKHGWLCKKSEEYVCLNCGTRFWDDDTCPCGSKAIIKKYDEIMQ